MGNTMASYRTNTNKNATEMCRQNTIKNATKTNKIILSELFNVLKVLPRTMLYLMHTKVC